MRTTKKSIQVGPSQQGSRPQKTTLAKGTKGTSSVASSTSKKRKAASRISGPMGSGVFGVRVFVPRGRNPSSPVLHVDLEEHISFKVLFFILQLAFLSLEKCLIKSGHKHILNT